MANNLKETGDSTNWPTLSERDWYVISICLALGAAIAALFAAIWVFEASTVRAMKARLDLVTPFGAIYLALVTFSTVAWRGMVTSRQADQQKRQNDANDEANFSKLLQEAAKLIAEKEKVPQVIAGISTLEILLTEPQKRFAVEAMDLLADLLIETHGKKELSNVSRAALRALATGERAAVRSRIHATFEQPKTRDHNKSWPHIAGMRSLTLIGGTLTGGIYKLLKNNSLALKKVTLVACEINEDINVSNCKFQDCEITKVHEFDLEMNEFKDCNFSGCIVEILVDAAFVGMTEGRNYYHPSTPPRDTEGNDISHLFITYDEYRVRSEDDIPF